MHNDGSGIVQVFIGGIKIDNEDHMLDILKKTFLTSNNESVIAELELYYQFILENFIDEIPISWKKYDRKEVVNLLFARVEHLNETLRDLENELGLLSFHFQNGYCYIGEMMEFQGVFETELTEEQLKYLIENGKAFLKMHNIDESRFRLYHFTSH